MPMAVSAVGPGGNVVLLGLSGGELTEIRGDDIVLKQLSVRGSIASEPEDWAAVAEFMRSGKLQSVVTHKFHGLEQFEDAVEHVRSPPEGMIKLQLFIGHDSGKARATEHATVTEHPAKKLELTTCLPMLLGRKRVAVSVGKAPKNDDIPEDPVSEDAKGSRYIMQSLGTRFI